MFDKSRLDFFLESYKKDFVTTQWADEKYKWEAVKGFQDDWDVNAVDFVSMLKNSLNRTENLLVSNNYFPSKMILTFAGLDPEKVRAMFIALFDENEEVFERIEAFKTQSAILLEKYGEGAKQHYQNENAISTYLWLRYPDKYYIYKFGEVKTVARELASDYRFKKGAYADNIRNSILLYNEICNELHKDKELVEILHTHLTPSCYPDPELKTLTIDVGFYISRYYSKKDLISDDSWIPVDYSPKISMEKWIELLNDKEIFTPSSLEIMKRLKDYGGMATCTQLETKYGENKNFYNSGSVSLARRIAEKNRLSSQERRP